MWKLISLLAKLAVIFICLYIVGIVSLRIGPGLILTICLLFIIAGNILAVKEKLLQRPKQSVFFFALPLVLLFIGESLFYPGLWSADTIYIFQQLTEGERRLHADYSVIFPLLSEFGYAFIGGPLYYLFFIVLAFVSLQTCLYKALIDYKREVLIRIVPLVISSPAIIIFLIFPGRDALFGLISATLFLCVVPLKDDLLSDKKRFLAVTVLFIYACMLRPEGRFLIVLVLPVLFNLFGNKFLGLLKTGLVLWLVILIPTILNNTLMSALKIPKPTAYNHSLTLHMAINTLAEAEENNGTTKKIDQYKTKFGEIFHVPFDEVEKTRVYTSNGWAHMRFIGNGGRTAQRLGINLHEVRRWERAVVKAFPKAFLQERFKIFSLYLHDLWTFRDMAREPDLEPIFKNMAIPEWPEESLVYKTLRIFQGVYGPQWLQYGITLFIWLPWWLVLQVLWQLFHPGRLQEHSFYWAWLACSFGVIFFITPEPRFAYIFYIYLISLLMNAFLTKPRGDAIP